MNWYKKADLFDDTEHELWQNLVEKDPKAFKHVPEHIQEHSPILSPLFHIKTIEQAAIITNLLSNSLFKYTDPTNEALVQAFETEFYSGAQVTIKIMNDIKRFVEADGNIMPKTVFLRKKIMRLIENELNNDKKHYKIVDRNFMHGIHDKLAKAIS